MNSDIPIILFKDFYKTDHRRQYPPNTTKVYSNLTARISRIPGIDNVVVFGIQAFIQEFLINRFEETFFDVDKEEVIGDYQRRMDNALGGGVITTGHLELLHDLQYLPIEIKALAEGTLAPLRIPILTITNTHPDFAWLPNFLETLISNGLWHGITTATIAFEYRKILERYAKETSDMPEFVKWQGHDFSMRGSASPDGSASSGAGHLLSFTGTDTIPAIDFVESHYGANSDIEMIGGSIAATEHAVQCLGGKETEFETYKRLITEVYPNGMVSIVSDTWDFWKCLTEIIGGLKAEIMARNGKVVVRPDSGDPELILCGDPESENENARKGAVQILWEIFGGTTNSKGYKQLDSHIGLIYGDSITLERAEAICSNLKAQGFASTNVVFGIGSYTYQYVTRDTFGFAMKATYGVVDGKPVEIFKDPLTDGGVKKSAKGLLRVNADLSLSECVTPQEEREGLLQTVFVDGITCSNVLFKDIRARIDSHFVENKELK